MKDYITRIQDYSRNNYSKMTRQPAGMLKYPFIVPGSQYYSDCLWDWDSWFTDIAVRQIMKDNKDTDAEFAACEKGCILNFLEHTAGDGRMPIFIAADEMLPDMDADEQTNIHKPCLAQHAAFVIRESGGDCEWLKPYMAKMEGFIHYYLHTMRHEKTGLYFWLDDMAIGVDNDPCTFYRPNKSSASVYLNCLMYRELLAFSYICKQMGAVYEEYEAEAQNLKEAVNRYLWDERNGFYYSADLNLKPIDPGQWLHSGMPRHWDSVIQKIDCWSGFMTMWAGIADEERAHRMVYENLKRPDLFEGAYGIRTLAKTEQMFALVKSANPSCWLGPVWGISNYICYRGLMNYGFAGEAEELALKTIQLFGKDLEKCGEMHEYYHPDTGEGLNNPGFQNWNLLVNNMIAEMEGRCVVKEF